MRKIVYFLFLMVSFCAGRWTATRTRDIVREVKTIVRVDTVRVTQPEVIVVHPRPAVIERLRTVQPTECDTDTVCAVYVPVEQRVYQGEGYKAFVSGHLPQLDSIEFYRPVTVAGRRNPSRISVAFQVGYGITPRGPQPYAGIGISVRIL